MGRGGTAVTVRVVTGKVWVAAPAAKVTDTGTVAAFRLLLVRVTTAPPAGAATPRVTVAVLLAPPVTAAGLSVSPATAKVGRAAGRGRGGASVVGVSL